MDLDSGAGRHPLSAVHDVLEQGKPLLAAAALVIYGVVRVAIDTFYRTLGVSADQVGLTEAQILGKSALYFIGSVAIVFAIAGIWISPMLWYLERHALKQNRTLAAQPRFFLALAPLLFLFVTPALLLGLAPNFVNFLLARPVRILAALVALGSLLLASLLIAWVSGEVSTLGIRTFRIRAWAEVLLLTIVAVLASVSFFLAHERGVDLASSVREGKAVHVALLSASADPVCVAWKSRPTDSHLDNGPYMFLGEPGSLVLLYDYRSQAKGPVRIPAGDIVLTPATRSHSTNRTC